MYEHGILTQGVELFSALITVVYMMFIEVIHK